MQDKVHFNPPKPIEMFGGKPPPTSWVNENIVRFLQIQSNTEFLRDVLSFMGNLQRAQLMQARLAGPQLPLAPAPLPEEAAPAQVANAASFNAFQPLVKEQIEVLTQLIAILKQADPPQAKELQGMLQQLSQMGKSFPKLSEEQLSQLSSMMAKMTEWVKSLPINTQRNFWDQKMLMLQRMLQSLEESIKNDKNQLEKLALQIKQLQKLKDSSQTMQGLVNRLAAKPPSSSEVSQMLSALQALADTFPQLPSHAKKALSKHLQHLAKLSGKKGASLPSLLSAALVKEWATQFLKNNPNATSAQLRSYIQQIFQNSNLNKSDIPFIKEMGHAIEEALEKETLPFGAPAKQESVIRNEGGKVVPNEDSIQKLSSTVEVQQKSVEESDSLQANAQKSYVAEISKNQNVVEGLRQSVATHEKTRASLGKSAAWGATQSHGGSSGSLPNQFRHAILGHYMPAQEAYLFELANILSFDNMGASLGNVLLNKMIDFGAASVNYSFGNSLNKTNGEYSGSYKNAQNKLNNEKTSCQTDLEEIMKTQIKIAEEIDKIQNDPNLSASQKAEMIGKLQNIQNNLSQAWNQVTNLEKVLNTITISPGSDDQHFTISSSDSNWQDDLNKGEYAVINGDPSQKDPGGLTQTQSLVQNFQQDYSNQSQDQQMMLQMTMTETQQEWTIVSTALQLLNRAYMAFAQGIYH